jgi:hypothetical protein
MRQKMNVSVSVLLCLIPAGLGIYCFSVDLFLLGVINAAMALTAFYSAWIEI